ncbi:MAG: hydrogenase maturation nickel metallochaperone HypA [Desulfobacterium sp.]|nr:hydrogenase maturation nickel metallochaperone HypA [Desulfobacterium sp.]
MHEMGIAMQIIEIATSSIPDELENASIKKVNVKIGKLSAVVPESLRFCFEIAAKDTCLSGAELDIEEIPVRARCRECSKEWTIHDPDFKCIECGSGSIDILSGRELDITSIEVQ